jgi:hypothetical protein
MEKEEEPGIHANRALFLVALLASAFHKFPAVL